MYEISKGSFKIAKQYGLQIQPSTKKNKKIDVYKQGEYVASIGDSRFKDFHIYLKEQGEAYANERARLYYGRHQKVSMKEQLAKLLLWT